MNGSSPKSSSSLNLRLIELKDNAAVAKIIRQVMTEFGAVGAGYAIQDPEVDAMYEAYLDDAAEYWVIEESNTRQVLGGGGVAPLKICAKGDDNKRVAEIQKMYFLPEIRGTGWGKKLLTHLLERAKNLAYEQCYLETLHSMSAATRLYEASGFERLERPMGSTGHTGCNRWYAKALIQNLRE